MAEDDTPQDDTGRDESANPLANHSSAERLVRQLNVLDENLKDLGQATSEMDRMMPNTMRKGARKAFRPFSLRLTSPSAGRGRTCRTFAKRSAITSGRAGGRGEGSSGAAGPQLQGAVASLLPDWDAERRVPNAARKVTPAGRPYPRWRPRLGPHRASLVSSRLRPISRVITPTEYDSFFCPDCSITEDWGLVR